MGRGGLVDGCGYTPSPGASFSEAHYWAYDRVFADDADYSTLSRR